MSDNNEILSQDEINKLLNSITVEIVDAAEKQPDKNPPAVIRLYDFRRPEKFSEDLIYEITRFHEGFCRLLIEHISLYTEKKANIAVASVDQLLFEEFTRSIPVPTSLGIFNMGEKAPALLEVDPILSVKLLKSYLGGERLTFREIRPLSIAEKKILSVIFEGFIQTLSTIWKPVIKQDLEFKSLEQDIPFALIVPPEEMVCLVSLNIEIEDISNHGIINICYPSSSIEYYLDAKGSWGYDAEMTEEKKPFYSQKEVEKTLLSSYAVFDGDGLTVNKILYPDKEAKVDSFFKEKGALRYE